MAFASWVGSPLHPCHGNAVNRARAYMRERLDASMRGYRQPGENGILYVQLYLRTGAELRSVGVRELQNHASQIVREVTTQRRPVNITRHGRVVARITPVEEGLDGDELELFEQVWSQMDDLAAEISARWPEGLSAAEAISSDRE